MTYFIINNDSKVYSITNFDYYKKLNDCYFIKYIYGVFFLDIKQGKKMICKNKLIGDYNNLIKFLNNNVGKVMCISGISRASMGEIVQLFNESNNLKVLKKP